MNCQLCKENKAIYEYELVDKKKIYICKECGRILYQASLDYYDRLSQLCVIQDFVEQNKALTKKM